MLLSSLRREEECIVGSSLEEDDNDDNLDDDQGSDEEEPNALQDPCTHGDLLGHPQALKGALREDPDVILVGELRDLETIGMALTAAETGHLVFASLHTNDAIQTIDRIIDVFPAHQQDHVYPRLSDSKSHQYHKQPP